MPLVMIPPGDVVGLPLVKALVLGVVEGLTEFLPISSTGHLILAGALLDFDGEKAKVFEIVIQTGAVLAVVWEYRARFAKVIGGLGSDPRARRFALNILIAFMPAAVLGLALGKHIKELFFRPVVVALAFTAQHLGADHVLWASDYPHPDAKIPGVVAELEEAVESLSPDAQAEVFGASARRFYNL